MAGPRRLTQLSARIVQIGPSNRVPFPFAAVFHEWLLGSVAVAVITCPGVLQRIRRKRIECVATGSGLISARHCGRSHFGGVGWPRSSCMFNSTPGIQSGVSSFGESRGRSFDLVRLDLWLQIDPSASHLSAGYILRRRRQQVGATPQHLLHQVVTQETPVPQQQHVLLEKTRQVGGHLDFAAAARLEGCPSSPALRPLTLTGRGPPGDAGIPRIPGADVQQPG